MKHKINASQTRKAELNVHPLGLISKYPCKHFPFQNAKRLEPTRVNLDFSNVKFILFSLKITKGNVKIPYMLNICSQFCSDRCQTLHRFRNCHAKGKAKPKRTMNYKVQEK